MIGLLWALLACTSEPVSPPPLPALPPELAPTPAPPLREARPIRTLTLALTGEVQGEVTPCGCPTVPYGGFERRAGYLRQLRAEGDPLFVLDAGHMLVKAGDLEGRKERGRVVLDLAKSVGLDAWAVGPLDLLPGGPELLAGTGALSANWRAAEGAAPFPGARVIERDGLRLGVLGVSAPTERYRSEDPVVSARAAIAAAGPADAWVALSNAPPAVTRAVAEGIPELGLVVALRDGVRDPPLTTAGAPVVETSDRGRTITVVRAFLGATPGPWELTDQGPAAAAAALARGVAGAVNPAARAENEARLAQARVELATVGAGRDLAVLEDQPLGAEFEGDAGIRARLVDFRAETIAAAGARVAAPDAPKWGTAAACARCHSDFMARWVGTSHARAHESLIQRGQSENPECIGCHTTGWGEPGGFSEPSRAALSTWKGVQCEACHGALGGHPGPAATPAEVTRGTCLACHDEANSPQFDYDWYRLGVSCVQLLADKSAGAAPTADGPEPRTPAVAPGRR